MIRALLLVPFLFSAFHIDAASWGRNRLWNDGRAEVAIYDSERIVYDEPRRFKEQLIIVAEEMRTDTWVKADEPKKTKTIPVFKLNVVQKFDTQNYPYSYLASVFVKEENLSHVVKITVGSQEWCGNTFKEYLQPDEKGPGTLMWHSYFDGEENQTVSLEIEEGDLFEDQLPVFLRGLPFDVGYEQSGRIWSLLTNNRGVKPEPVKATVRVVGTEMIRSRAGSHDSWKVEIKKTTGTDTYWFDKEYPHIMTKMETADGQKRLLYGKARWKYWDRRLPMPNILK